jgi:hypothetical protein
MNIKLPVSMPVWARVSFHLLLGAAYFAFLVGTIPSVPFHPDEATYIYMSKDAERIFGGNPLSVCWAPEKQDDPLQKERERDCPLARYTIGLSRLSAGLPATDSNWDWSLSWGENLRRGAMPSDALLVLSRLPQALLLFVSVLLMIRLGYLLGGHAGAMTAGVMMGLNSQLLLHGRRVMSESGLVFGMILVATVVMTQRERAGGAYRWLLLPSLAGIALAVAASAKYSALMMVPVMLVGMFVDSASAVPPQKRQASENIRDFPKEGSASPGASFNTSESGVRPRRKTISSVARLGIIRSGVALAAFLAVFLALNPMFWCNPAATASAVIAERQQLLKRQVKDLRTAAPGLVLDSIPVRLLAIPYQLYLAPLGFWDVPNYAAETAKAENTYLSNPLNGLTVGGILPLLGFVLGTAGIGVAVFRGVKEKTSWRIRLLCIWFLSVAIGIVIGLPIMWQRYYLPLIPPLILFAALAVSAIWEKIRRLSKAAG